MRRRTLTGTWGAPGPVLVRTIALGLLLADAAGCRMLPDALWRPPTPPSAPTPLPAASASGLSVTALPVYRLIAMPALADAPSRLLVVQVRLRSTIDGALSIGPDDLALSLPNGVPARVFDRPRAVEILRRTMLADGDVSYLQRGGDHPPGGLDTSAQARLSDLVLGSLLTDEAFAGGQDVLGFVVVDTGVPLASLDGAQLQVVAYRLRDAAPVAAAYQFTPPPTAATETPAS
jgi:hypothetical protein